MLIAQMLVGKNSTSKRKIHHPIKEFRTFSPCYKGTQQTTPLYKGAKQIFIVADVL